jgi:hypothetical protein
MESLIIGLQTINMWNRSAALAVAKRNLQRIFVYILAIKTTDLIIVNRATINVIKNDTRKIQDSVPKRLN